jgi:hypothetical protein
MSQLMAVAINCNYNQLLMGFGHPKIGVLIALGGEAPVTNGY